MSDKLQITFPIDNWTYMVQGSISDDNTAFINVLVPCNRECPWYLEDCNDYEKCPYDNPRMEQEILEQYSDRMVKALKSAAEILGIDLKLENVERGESPEDF